MTSCRIRLTFHGRVQGVGFRPYVWRTVRAYPLTGFVRN
ncbi:MAG: acylphosphatase, partial [Steroidobacteraceae bacterium]